MFNIFKSKNYEPLNYELRKYFENNLLWLNQEFPEPKVEQRRILLPTPQDFPITWNGERDTAYKALEIVCGNMGISSEEVELHFYKNASHELNAGLSKIYTQNQPESFSAAGLYHYEKENEKFQISLDEGLMSEPESLIATIAHELAHVKLLGGNKIDENDEMLTDFATVFFGLGVFNANVSFQFYQNPDGWGHRSSGYLKLDEWAYALALFAFIRQEDKPEWRKYLSKVITKDFDRCLKYLFKNEDEIFRFENDGK